MMNKVYDYVVAVTTRYPDQKVLKLNQPQLLAHDIRYDIEHNNLYDYTDEQLLEHIDSRIHYVEFKQAFRLFKRNYRRWLRRKNGQ